MKVIFKWRSKIIDFLSIDRNNSKLVFHTILQNCFMLFMLQKYLYSYILKMHHWFRQFSVGNTIYEKKGTDIAIINSKVTL